MGRNRLVAIFIALLLGVGGTTVLVRYVRASEQRALAGQELVEVFVVSEPIDEGTPAAEVAGSIQAKQVPVALRADGAITDVASLGELVVTTDLLVGEQLVNARFGSEIDRTVAGGKAVIPEGLLEVTFFANVERGIGGQIVPGETVSVVATFDGVEVSDGSQVAGEQQTQVQAIVSEPQTHFLLRKALIVNVQTDVAPILDLEDDTATEERSRSLPTGELLVTVALAPGDVERLVFAREFGSLWLAREPEFVPEDPTPIVSYDGIFTNVLDDDAPTQPKSTSDPDPAESLEPEPNETEPRSGIEQPTPDRLASTLDQPGRTATESDTDSAIETEDEPGAAGE